MDESNAQGEWDGAMSLWTLERPPSRPRGDFYTARSSTNFGHAMANALIKNITDASFESDVLKADTPVLVDYWAEWCGPCVATGPVLDDLASEYKDKLQVAKMNVDENSNVPAKFGIRGIPTFMLFKDGQLAATKVGAMSKAQFSAFIEQHLEPQL